jgi:hypothetical protein
MKLRKPWPERLTFLTRRFSPSVGPFDAPVTWWLRISARQRVRVRPRDRISSTPVGAASFDRLVEKHGGFGGVVGAVDVPDGFLRRPGAHHITVRVADARLEQHPVEADPVEPLGAFQQQLADPV